jgi:hypothetical protein
MRCVPRRTLSLVPLLLALAACGGGGTTLAKKQYDTKVSRLCLLAADQMREIHMDASVSAWQHSGATVVRIAQQFATALAKLHAPDDIAADATAYLKADKKLVADYKAAVAAANAGDRATLRAAGEQSTKDGGATFPLAKAIGATGCYIG